MPLDTSAECLGPLAGLRGIRRTVSIRIPSANKRTRDLPRLILSFRLTHAQYLPLSRPARVVTRRRRRRIRQRRSRARRRRSKHIELLPYYFIYLNAPDPTRHPQYRFVPVPDGISGPAPVAIEDVVARIIALGAACEPAFHDHLAAVLEEDEYSRDAVACLVADAHLLLVFQVAAGMGVPALALRTSSAASYACFAAYPTLYDRGYLPVQDSQLDMPVPELPPYQVRDLMQLGKGGHGLMREILAHAVAAVEASSGLILNAFDELERGELAGIRQDLAAMVPVFDVVPLHKLSPAAAGDDSSLLRQDRACLEWLDAWPPESVLYVSFGILACMTPRDLAETAAATSRYVETATFTAPFR